MIDLLILFLTRKQRAEHAAQYNKYRKGYQEKVIRGEVDLEADNKVIEEKKVLRNPGNEVLQLRAELDELKAVVAELKAAQV